MANRVLNGELGYKGERGFSAYEIAVQNGYEGTEEEWIDHFGLDLSGYLQTDDVIDALDSTYTTRPLSANQGKVLNGLIDTLDSKVDNDKEVHTFTIHEDDEDGTIDIEFKRQFNIVCVRCTVELKATSNSLSFLKTYTNFPEWLKISSESETNQTIFSKQDVSGMSEYNSTMGYDTGLKMILIKRSSTAQSNPNQYMITIGEMTSVSEHSAFKTSLFTTYIMDEEE